MPEVDTLRDMFLTDDDLFEYLNGDPMEKDFIANDVDIDIYASTANHNNIKGGFHD